MSTAPKLRSTRQRAAVAEALEGINDFRSAQEIHALLRSRGDSVGLTTVYRTLATLAEAGEVDAIRTDDGETVYRRCATSRHHHHVVCRYCGHTVEVQGPAVERWAERVAGEAGFVDVTHTVEVFGTCPDCARGARGKAAGETR
ncbi:Fur family transcriptional regulator [Thermasporomyces composti]|uniref:Fur family zinc uptake regulator n=1 Tax=Thermasporomyces composti TaxID=696763 RepID=A0A3D9VAS3_THECX|nr:transcriptional repressor [Thermasporomyces composti]REF37813.1 Fur family zinc uptake regulator [Thermasporomyces composti]